VIQIGGGKWKLYRWHEFDCPIPSPRFYDRTGARMWLQQVHTNSFDLAALRSELTSHQSTGLWRCSDEEVLQLVADKLVSGELLVCLLKPLPALTTLIGNQASQEAAPAFPLSERGSSSNSGSPDSQEQAVFNSNADLVAIAAVLKDAARSGTPF
jgi:hypothetical protein